jgi:2-polyprenyl-6-methoxyphenol hydroxylase-like FAD-dependent oxidoreductase
MGNLNFKHPEMQQVLLEAASQAGAEVLRGSSVNGVAPGNPAIVSISDKAGTRDVAGRLIVGADGRDSKVRNWAGFEVLRDPTYLFAASALLRAPADLAGSVHYMLDPVTPRSAFIVPVAEGYFRPYLMYRNEAIGRRLSGERDAATFMQNCVALGASKDWFEDVQIAGPLATFDGAFRWVEHPYLDGVVLVGDAASSSDPSWGNGLSMTLRDVRLLSERLRADSDWRQSASDYAGEQAVHRSRLRRGEALIRDLFFEPGEAAFRRRMHAMKLMEDEPEREPDLFGLGPDAPCDDAARARFYGED